MIKSKNGILIALILPIFALGALVVRKKYILTSGNEVTLSIEGYDPRDLLSGHYLVYRVNYGVEGICKSKSKKYSYRKRSAYVCLDPKIFSYTQPNSCDLLIKGTCSRNRFKAGIERYYVPEKNAKTLEGFVLSKRGSIVISVLENGKAQIKDLLVDGVPWKNKINDSD